MECTPLNTVFVSISCLCTLYRLLPQFTYLHRSWCVCVCDQYAYNISAKTSNISNRFTNLSIYLQLPKYMYLYSLNLYPKHWILAYRYIGTFLGPYIHLPIHQICISDVPHKLTDKTRYWHIDTLVLFLDLTYIYQYIKYVYPTYPIS